MCSVESTRWPVSAAVMAARGGLQVAHFADQDDVGVLAQDVPQAAGEAGHVAADLALLDEALVGCAGRTRSGLPA